VIRLNVRFDITGFTELMNVAKDQIPFATALALTNTAKAVKDDIRAAMGSSFTHVASYTLNSLYLQAAKKRELNATVGVKGDDDAGAVNWLRPEVEGGVRGKSIEKLLNTIGLPPDGMFAVPGKAAKISKGNISYTWLQSLVADMNAQGVSGVVTKTNSRRRKGTSSSTTRYFVLIEKRGKLVPGIWGAKGRTAYPFIIFVKQPRYGKKLNFYGIAKDTAQRRFPSEFAAAVRQAMATRK
jgi:hypothetical protein